MATTVDQKIAALEEAMASGALTVDFPDGKRIQYRSQGDLLGALQYFQAQKAAQTGKKPVTVSVGTYFRG